jgi:hypothetical protein
VDGLKVGNEERQKTGVRVDFEKKNQEANLGTRWVVKKGLKSGSHSQGWTEISELTIFLATRKDFSEWRGIKLVVVFADLNRCKLMDSVRFYSVILVCGPANRI